MISTVPKPITYPDSDGLPMAENTEQCDLIILLRGNLDIVFTERNDVFVAANNLIYTVEGDVKVRQAPDVYVAFGRPKGRRGSYKVWAEDGIFPQVIFEVLSPGNRGPEMARKFNFYERYGTQEYYVIDPDHYTLSGWLREGDRLKPVSSMHGFRSPRLGMVFDVEGELFTFTRPDGKPFLNHVELDALLSSEAIERKISDAARRMADAARDKAEAERDKANRDRTRLEVRQKITDGERRVAESERRAAEVERDAATAERDAAAAERDAAAAERERFRAMLIALGVDTSQSDDS